MWDALRDIAHKSGYSVDDLVTEINRMRGKLPLPTTIRHYIVEYYRESLRRVLANAKPEEGSPDDLLKTARQEGASCRSKSRLPLRSVLKGNFENGNRQKLARRGI